MTTENPIPAPASTVPDPGSLSDRLARARKARQERKQKPITLVVPGTDGQLAAQYKILDYEKKVEITGRHGIDPSDLAGSLLGNGTVQVQSSADMLINACTDLLEVVGADENGDPKYQSLGLTWNAASIAKLFQVEQATTAREAILNALDHEDIVAHYGQYVRAAMEMLSEDPEKQPGESKPSAEG